MSAINRSAIPGRSGGLKLSHCTTSARTHLLVLVACSCSLACCASWMLLSPHNTKPTLPTLLLAIISRRIAKLRPPAHRVRSSRSVLCNSPIRSNARAMLNSPASPVAVDCGDIASTSSEACSKRRADAPCESACLFSSIPILKNVPCITCNWAKICTFGALTLPTRPLSPRMRPVATARFSSVSVRTFSPPRFAHTWNGGHDSLGNAPGDLSAFKELTLNNCQARTAKAARDPLTLSEHADTSLSTASRAASGDWRIFSRSHSPRLAYKYSTVVNLSTFVSTDSNSSSHTAKLTLPR
mmetsp:Transcript_110906/g.195936  ORF Transcript_110906/g.195936 Transcript_110906/m.195936 type:complete len:298 (-) Transcript_110906:268-1161(-)